MVGQIDPELDRPFQRGSVQPSDEVRSQFALASKPLSTWPRTLGDSHWVERPEADALLDHIESKPHYECVLLGGPGSGKSALLAHLARCLDANGTACLGIKADTLDVNVDSLGKLAERLQLPATVADCVAALARTVTRFRSLHCPYAT